MCAQCLHINKFNFLVWWPLILLCKAGPEGGCKLMISCENKGVLVMDIYYVIKGEDENCPVQTTMPTS